MDSKQNSRTRQIDFLRTYYNSALVDSAVKYADDRIARHSSHPNDRIMLKLARDYAIEAGQTEIADFIEGQMESDMNSTFDDLTFAYIDGILFGLNNPNADKIPEPVTDYVLNKDFAFLFDYSDNDFSGLVQDAAQIFCDEYNALLRQIELYSDLDKSHPNGMAEHYKKDLEYMENPANVRQFMKALFIGEYMSRSADRPRLDNKGLFSAINRLKKAEDLVNNYLPFDEKDNEMGRSFWKFGTWKEVSDYGLERYKRQQSTEELEYANGDFTKYWLNGEVLIVRMVNGRLVVEQ